jgi:hypothetical protein
MKAPKKDTRSQKVAKANGQKKSTSKYAQKKLNQARGIFNVNSPFINQIRTH